jgi:alpha-D-ribose 1-methylphosphonate 5-triphosphate diphosphatase PhnM
MVDTLSTDYAGGAWEPMLGVADRWYRRGFIDLREVALMTATRTADLLGLRDRGRLDEGKRSDVVVVSADDLASVRGVFVAGHRVT